jgi:hypothetical protein
MMIISVRDLLFIRRIRCGYLYFDGFGNVVEYQRGDLYLMIFTCNYKLRRKADSAAAYRKLTRNAAGLLYTVRFKYSAGRYRVHAVFGYISVSA